MGKIAFLDSGSGGLNILAKTIKILPEAEYVYVADTKNCPYGIHSKTWIFNKTKNLIENIIKNYLPDIIVIACNTASSACAKEIRNIFNIPIVAVEPAIKMVPKNEFKLVLATKATLKFKKIKSNKLTLAYAPQNLPKLIDDNLLKINKINLIIKKELKQVLKNNNLSANKIKNIVLGCTHFVAITKTLKKIFVKTNLFSGHEQIATQIKKIYLLNNNKQKNNKQITINNKIKFYCTNKCKIKLNKNYLIKIKICLTNNDVKQLNKFKKYLFKIINN
ncbi:MAG: aspartate/glutamate racemase family protein [Clostridia bacterium]